MRNAEVENPGCCCLNELPEVGPFRAVGKLVAGELEATYTEHSSIMSEKSKMVQIQSLQPPRVKIAARTNLSWGLGLENRCTGNRTVEYESQPLRQNIN